jgi:ubiquinone/menaquinone biosynthesis C-methylase UbiE
MPRREAMAYHPDSIRNAYDGYVENEDRFEKGFSLRNDIPREFIKRFLQADDVVLDAGGGAGINAIMMARRCKHVTLLDLSPGMVERASANVQQAGLGDKIDLVEGDITCLEQFEDAQFSFVVCLGGSLSYVLDEAPRAMREFVRVSQPGAILIVGCDSKYGFLRWILGKHKETQLDIEERLEWARQVCETSDYEPGESARAFLYTVGELKDLIEEAGCEILEMASTPTLAASWDQSSYPEEKRQELLALELQVCTVPELLGIGHHLFCVARKN